MNSSSLIERVRKAGKVLIIGNGGSAANADHVVNDLLSVGVRAFAISPSFFSASANDYGYYHSFLRWIRVVGEKGDLLIALSGSGKSPNILMACEEAERIGMDVHREFGAAQGLDMQAAEEAQIALGHQLMRELKQ